MNTSISGVIKQLGSAFNKLGKGMKILIFSFIGIIIIGAVIMTVALNSNNYTVLYRGLSASESSEILGLLDDMAVDVKVDTDGSILVPTDDVAALKMQLASEGYPNSTLDYDLFINQSDMLTNDYEQKKLYTFQLQDRLQDSIETLQGVKSAIVTLGIPDDNSYVLKDEQVDITASVTLQLYSNAKLTNKQINGIVSLVTKSVPNLASENVVIIGEDGEQLNVGTDTADSDSKMDTVNQLNDIFEEKIKDFLAPVFGNDGMSIAVNIKVDFNQVTSEETTYTPVIGDNGIISWIEKSSDSTGGALDSGTTDEVPTYDGSDTAAGDTDASTSDSYSAQYLVNQLVKTIQDSGGNITDMTVAVIINTDELSDEDKAKYKELIANSAGISVDKVALTNAKFLESTNVIPVSDDDLQYLLTLKLGTKDVIIISGSSFVLLMLILTAFLISRHRKKKKIKLVKEAEKARELATDKGKMPGEIVLNETREQALKRQIKEFSSANAETVAQLLRVWIKEDENK
jgi:flagellar basal-body M-ring protein/flagellar hook-basal body protein (fliF)